MALKNIIDKLISVAEEKAKTIEEDAKKQVHEVKLKNEVKIKEQTVEMSKKLEEAKQELQSKILIETKISAKAKALQDRRLIVAKGITMLSEKLEKMSDKEYENFLTKLLEKVTMEISSGEVVSAKSRLESLKKILKNFPGLVLSEKTKDIKGGFILESLGVEVDCSFENLIHQTFFKEIELIFSRELFN